MGPTQRAVVSGHFTRGATTFVRNAADTADIVLAIVVANVPAPLRDGVPVLYDNFHGGQAARLDLGVRI